jgi:hypothetical protein
MDSQIETRGNARGDDFRISGIEGGGFCEHS